MVEELERIAKLLEIPNLEPETVQQINAAIRVRLAELGKPPNPQTQVGFLPQTMLDEWYNGAKPAQQEGG